MESKDPIWEQYDDLDDIDIDALIKRIDTVALAKHKDKAG